MSTKNYRTSAGPWHTSGRARGYLAGRGHSSVCNNQSKHFFCGRRDRHPTPVQSRMTSFITVAMPGREPSASRPRRDLSDLLGT